LDLIAVSHSLEAMTKQHRRTLKKLVLPLIAISMMTAMMALSSGS